MQRKNLGTTPTSITATSDHNDNVRCGVNSSNNNDMKEEKTQRHQPRQQKASGARISTAHAANGSGSLLWVILLIGLVLCVTDVVYMMGVLERTGKAGIKKKHHHHKNKNSKKEEERRRKEAEALEDQEDLSNYINSTEYSDKERILNLVRDAGITYIDRETYDSLPTWKEVSDLYGTSPKIVGLDTCEEFQNYGYKFDHFIGVAGNFNTGTNLLAELLIANCHMQDRMDKFGDDNRGIRWQVPWGKHTPPGDEDFRTKHKTEKDKNIDANSIIPIVTVRDPYQWMQSMCRHEYSATWIKADHCPNIVPTADNRRDHPELAGKVAIPIGVKYKEFRREYESMIHFWNEYNHEYFTDIDIPRIMVRYEDLLFYPKKTVNKACKCAGGTMRKDGEFKYVAQSAKKGDAAHGPQSSRTGYVDAMIKYGSAANRFNEFTPHDLKYINDNINMQLMNRYDYTYYPKEKLVKTLKSLKEEKHKLEEEERNKVQDSKKKLASSLMDAKEMENHVKSVKSQQKKRMRREEKRDNLILAKAAKGKNDDGDSGENADDVNDEGDGDGDDDDNMSQAVEEEEEEAEEEEEPEPEY